MRRRSTAIDRKQPMLPLRRGLPERQTHDDKRHGTISLFAALEVATGRVTYDTRERHTGADFLAFLKCEAGTFSSSRIGSRITTSAPGRSSLST